MTIFLVQATLHNTEYTHYTCQTREAADRLCNVLAIKRPHLKPIRVVSWEPSEKELARIVRFADDSPGPK